MAVYVISDTHFGHKNILNYGRKQFSSLEEMDGLMIGNWNNSVKPEDTVWHLGDFAFRNHLHYIQSLNGKIILVRGNHDKFSKRVEAGFAKVYDIFQGRLTGDKESPNFCLLHYPLVTWPKKAYGCIHLFGHVHGGYLRPGENALDVGVDVHGFRPLPLEEAISLAYQNANKDKKISSRHDAQVASTVPDQGPDGTIEFRGPGGPDGDVPPLGAS